MLDLKFLARVMAVAEKMANLKVKPPKCVLVPLAYSFSETIQVKTQAFLQQHVPGWAAFKVEAIL
eukprot:148096-Pyramimonas_sp.AAC.1